jgi:hypothetical protein
MINAAVWIEGPQLPSGKPEAIAATAYRSHYFWIARQALAIEIGLIISSGPHFKD